MKILFLITTLLIVSTSAMAQKITSINGRVIIDNRGMPSKTITTSKKFRTTSASNTQSPSVGSTASNDIANKDSNKTLSSYFELSKTNYNSGEKQTWKGAIDKCASIPDDGKGLWRMPTQRELMLIWILRKNIKLRIPDFTEFAPEKYWSASNCGYNGPNNPSKPYVNFNINGYAYNFGEGQSVNEAKSNNYFFRCVRDISSTI